jgi:hypothetical protein
MPVTQTEIAYRHNRARKFGQEAVPGALHDAATMLSYCWVDQISQERGQPSVRAFLIGVHEPRIAGHVGRQSAISQSWAVLHHRTWAS